MAKKKLQVVIKCSETVTYYQVKEMSQEEYDEIKQYDGQDLCSHEEGYDLIRDLVDQHDVYDTDDQFEGIEIYLEEKKPKRAPLPIIN